MRPKLIRSLSNIPPDLRGGVLTIGNFDGVHLGHQALISWVVSRAKQLQVPSIAVTFEPHPHEFFGKCEVARLTKWREKFIALAQQHVVGVSIVKFNQSVAAMSAGDFVGILQASFAPTEIIIGDDFRFGYQRQGDFSLLQEKGLSLGFAVHAVNSQAFEGERISSTRIRKALGEGNLALAQLLLGRPYTMQGRVVYGDQLGRRLGFPTANIQLHRKQSAVLGVFAVLVHGLTEVPLQGAANVGTRPTVDGSETILEVHLLDFNQAIYGRHVTVEFCAKFRDEIRYGDLGELKQQIAKDVEMTRQYFRTHIVNKVSYE